MLRVFHHYVSKRKLTLFAAEGTAIGLAGAAGAALLAQASAVPPATPIPLVMLFGLSIAIAVAFQFTLYLSDLYDFRVAREDRSRGARLLKAAGAAALAVAGVAAVFRLTAPTGTLLGAAAGAVAGALAIRGGIAPLVSRPSRVLVVGIGQRARGLVNAVEQDGEGAFEVVGFADLPRDRDGETVDAAAARLHADFVVLAADDARGFHFGESLVQCRFEGRRVYDAVGFCERMLRRLPLVHLRAAELAFADEMTASRGRRVQARLRPARRERAAPLRAADPGAGGARHPARIERAHLLPAGADGALRPRLLALEVPQHADGRREGRRGLGEEQRRCVTRVGRFIRKARIDEIPQVLNVLLGEMSFVGPRPERPVFVEQLKHQVPFYGLREGVKPGITGWAQIRYPYGASVEDARRKLEYDLYYVKNGSLFLNLGIMFHTVRHVLTGRGGR